jgi:O-methyltransferase
VSALLLRNTVSAVRERALSRWALGLAPVTRYSNVLARMLNLRDLPLYRRYQGFTMIPRPAFLGNLRLVRQHTPPEGAVVECGVWRGGMSAAVAQLLGPERDYYLFDSFEGLPPAKEIDGRNALAWQNNTTAPTYHDNCRAEIDYAKRAMALAGANRAHIVKGWFSETLPVFPSGIQIAVLRLDGDWYESTMACLDNLFASVVEGGLVIVDDYYTWDGCARAVHDFLSKTRSPCRLRQSAEGICFFIKTSVLEA